MKLFHKLGVAAMALTFGFAAGLTAEPAAIAAPSTDKSNGVVFDHVMLDGNPYELIPCIRVLRKYYNKARKDSTIRVELRIQYLSNGTVMEKYFVVKLDDMRLTDHHEQPNGDWRLVETNLDVSDAPPDEGTEFVGEATLLQDGVTAQKLSFTLPR